MRFISLFALAAATVFAAPAFAADGATTTTLYKSTGPDGRTVYSDRPPLAARDAKTLTFKNLPASPLSAETLAYIEQLRKSSDARMTAAVPRDTVLYSAKWCGYCRQAKAYLAAHQLAYREVDIDTPDGKMAYAQLGGNNGVPQLYVNGRGTTGFSASAYDSIFAQRR